MEFDVYVKDKKTIDLAKANVDALKYLVFFMVLFAVPFYLIWGFQLPKLNRENIILQALTPLLVLLVGILMHGIFFALFATKGFRSIKFGVLWKMLTPYCHCKEPLKIKHYKIGVLAPLVILGIIPALLNFVTGNIFF